MKHYLLSLLLLITLSFTTKSTDMDLGKSYNALAVKDIQASFNFYQNLGFEIVPNGGAVDQKWVVMQNGTTKIGLFQGMFPQNTITFNPQDARSIYRSLQEKGVATTSANGMDKEEGPCFFMLEDPDGNPILIDQH